MNPIRQAVDQYIGETKTPATMSPGARVKLARRIMDLNDMVRDVAGGAGHASRRRLKKIAYHIKNDKHVGFAVLVPLIDDAQWLPGTERAADQIIEDIVDWYVTTLAQGTVKPYEKIMWDKIFDEPFPGQVS